MSKYELGAPVVVNPPAIVRADSTRAEQVIGEIIKLDAKSKENAFIVGDLFVEFIDGDYHTAAHTETLQEFLKKYNIELSKREIQYRTKISRNRGKVGVDREQLVAAGISKAKAIFELDPQIDYEHEDGRREPMADIMRNLVEEAEGWKLSALKKEVKRLQGITDEEDEVVEEKVQYTVAQYRNVKLALLLIAKQSGTDMNEFDAPAVKGLLYERALDHYLQDPNNRAELTQLMEELQSADVDDEEEDSE